MHIHDSVIRIWLEPAIRVKLRQTLTDPNKNLKACRPNLHLTC